MAYTVLARKYRSWTFDQLVGQEAIATTLKNAIASGRLHHGYLFCGTRGVGKTSAARILARALNCLASEGPTSEPCCKCESCVAVAEGQDVDVIEIDAASNTGVDNIRELRSNANYRPARARFKIYIIDEVHMLSTGAFNALLKTLEEPPGHVKFIMATTESQKVPATIQSRCLRFDFRSIDSDTIAGHLEGILEKENVAADPAVIRRVARLANGSMRDGLSLLDQLMSMGSDRLTPEMLDDVLPTPHDDLLMELIGKMADNDAGGVLALFDKCIAGGYALERFAEALAEQVRQLMLLRVCGADTPLVELPSAARESALAIAGRFDAESYVHMIASLETMRRNVRGSAIGRGLMEAALVRLSSGVRYASVQSLLERLGGRGSEVSDSRSQGSASEAASKKKVASLAPAESSLSSGRTAPGPLPASSGQPAPAEAASPAVRPVSTGPRASADSPAPERGMAANVEDIKAASADPMVREALDLFDGSLVNVEKRS